MHICVVEIEIYFTLDLLGTPLTLDFQNSMTKILFKRICWHVTSEEISWD